MESNGAAYVDLGGLLYFRRSDLQAATDVWKRAHGHVPAATWLALSQRITQVQRDQLIERGFIARYSEHFDIRFQESSEADLTRIGDILEAAYARLSEQLDSPPARLTVLVYSEAELRRVYGQRDWALGFYDGRIRLGLNDLTAAHLEDIAAHELGHAFLHHRYGDRVPTWLHEGYAQLQERGRVESAETRHIEEGILSRTLWVPLKWLDRRFEQPSGTEDIARAYVQARVVVERLVSRHGMAAFRRFLEQLSEGRAAPEAYDQAFAPARWSMADQGLLE